ncbi:hypothetical protein HPJ99_06825 [Anoxybacillus flavithermus]|uniref:hypothetical protein n=1 Tax=Anoxybacillus flavithermus TaxID=33934 RepID=UPI001868E4CC|nr:hypothetical protein [Anoxybacillus flavithermus]MBE2934947.1 hypothetical protein [Anoxybacillus flavithermus]
MADKNIQMTQRNTSNTGWDNLYPITKASNVQVTPISGLSGTDVQTVLKNLFQFANSGKNSVASAIGSPASSSDTFSQLATHITNHKTSLANSLGSGSGVDSLQTLVNMRLQDLKNMLATNLTNKGQTASGTETLLNLINKVLNINTGKRWASGTISPTGTIQEGWVLIKGKLYQTNLLIVSIRNLGFTPSTVLAIRGTQRGIKGQRSHFVFKLPSSFLAPISDYNDFYHELQYRAIFHDISSNPSFDLVYQSIAPVTIVTNGFDLALRNDIVENNTISWLAFE